MVRRILLASFFLFAVTAQGAEMDAKKAYYGKFFTKDLERGDRPVSVILFEVLTGAHTPQKGDFDIVGENCAGPNCYRHTAVGYKRAREFMFGEFYLVKDGAEYGVKDVYCDRIAKAGEFNGAKPGPNVIPDHRVVNAEHTWPQSQFSHHFPGEDQKSDMHHLFPTDSEMNSKRSSFEFGDVVEKAEELKCSESRFGKPRSGKSYVFEPPLHQKGNTARALFYFSVRYGMKVDPEEEATLREWNKLDPVDAEEMARNERIFELQKSRNPFVDYPELVEKIKDF
jgi:endonuclease I